MMNINRIKPSFKGTTQIYALTDPHQETRKERALLSVVQQAASKNNNILLVNGGDLFKGIYPRELEAQNYTELKKLAPNLEIVIALGNNDFGFDKDGLEFLKNVCKDYKKNGINVVCANITDKNTGKIPEWVKPYKIIERDGDRIFVTGFCIESVNNTACGIQATPPKECLARLKDDIKKEKPDAIIILNHDWLSKSEELADFAKQNGIKTDMIIGGHEHDNLSPNHDKKIYYPYSFAQMMYKFDLNINKGINTLKNIEAIQSYRLTISKDFEKALTEAENKTKLLTPIAPYTLNLTKQYSQPCALGTFCADAMREAGNADISFFSTGFLMSPMPYKEGKDITLYDFKKTIIAESELQKVFVNADDLKEIFSNALKDRMHTEKGNARFLQASKNIKIEGFGNPDDLSYEIKQIYIGDTPLFDKITQKALNPDKYYSCIVDPFIAKGGQGFDTLKNKKKFAVLKDGSPAKINEVLLNALKEAPKKFQKGSEYPHYQIVDK